MNPVKTERVSDEIIYHEASHHNKANITVQLQCTKHMQLKG